MYLQEYALTNINSDTATEFTTWMGASRALESNLELAKQSSIYRWRLTGNEEIRHTGIPMSNPHIRQDNWN